MMFTELTVDLGDLEVHEKITPWPSWPTGIINVYRTRTKFPIKEGHVLRQAIKDCCSVISQARCEYKVGLAQSVSKRWGFYQDAEISEWAPTHLFVLVGVKNKVGAAYLESGLIAMPEVMFKERKLNINHQRSDFGGGGANWESTEHAVHFVYLAVKPTVCVWASDTRLTSLPWYRTKNHKQPNTVHF